MHLLILYGPPASGKLTIARLLAKKTNYPLLHNHLVADFAHALFEYGTDEYVAFAKRLRSDAVDAAIRAKLPGLIMTFAYGLETKEGKDDDAVLKAIVSRVRKNGGKTSFVRLTADRATLLKRIGRADRKRFHKLTKPTVLKHILATLRVEQEIPFANSLTIDTAKMSAAASVKSILKHLAK